MTYQHTNATFSPALSEGENQFLQHMSRWGSDGYPMRKVKGGWIWDEFFNIKGAPVVYKTKAECEAAIEKFIDILIARKAGRIEPSPRPACCVIEDGVFTIKVA